MIILGRWVEGLSNGLNQAFVASRKSRRAFPPSLVPKKDDNDAPGAIRVIGGGWRKP
jgi:hypothetical protein